MLGDTIVALGSAPGASARAVLRLSGGKARAAAEMVFSPSLPAVRAQVDGRVRWRDLAVDAFALVMPGPGSFTGEDVVELHLPGSPLLVRALVAALVADAAATGVREALPGEFTARACRNGRLDLAQAEGVLLLLHAHDQKAAAAAVEWLRGGLSATAAAVRDRLQDALALLEVGLDFSDGDTGEVTAAEWRAPLASAAGQLETLLGALPVAAPGGEVLLLGASNAGKSSLANALVGRDAVLVDGTPGTTRDLLRLQIGPDVAVWDAPGDLDAPEGVDAAALALRDRLAGRAAAALCVLDASRPVASPGLLGLPLPWLAVVWTKCDLVNAMPPLPSAVEARAAGLPVFATSAALRTGLEPLRLLLTRRAHASVVDAGGPLRSALQQALAAVRRAVGLVAAPPEVAAVELRQALEALAPFGVRHSPEHLLDRIYGRFCLGK